MWRIYYTVSASPRLRGAGSRENQGLAWHDPGAQLAGRVRMVKFLLLATLAACTEQQIHVATVVDSTLIACDVGQTYHESDGGRWDRPGDQPGTVRLEENPVLGPRPSPGLLAAGALFTVYATSIIGFSKMPKWARVGYLAVVGAAEGYIIAEHYPWDGACGAR